MARVWVAGAVLVAAAAAWWFLGGGERSERDAGSIERSSVQPDVAPPEHVLEGRGSADVAGAKGRAPRIEEDGARAEALGGFEILGRVVGAGRRPASGAVVTFHSPARTVPAARTGADGRFSVRIGPRPEAGWELLTVHVADRGGNAAASVAWVTSKGEERRDVGTLVLEPGHVLTARVTHGGAPVPGAVVEVASLLRGTPTTLRARAGPDGTATFPPMAAGAWRVVAAAPSLGRGTASGTLPQDAVATVDLPEARSLAVTVVERGSEKAVVGAYVTLQEHLTMGNQMVPYAPRPSIAPTDASGATRIDGLGTGEKLYASAGLDAPGPSGGSGDRGNKAVPLDASEVCLEVSPRRTVLWNVVPGEDGRIPAPGSEVRLRVAPGTMTREVPPSGRMEGTVLAVDGISSSGFHAEAIAADGSLAPLFWTEKEKMGKETSFRAPRTVDVRVRTATGQPVAGAYVALRNQGNNPVGEPLDLDAEGRATFRDLLRGRVEVYLSGDAEPFGGEPIGTVDIDKGSGSIDAVVGEELEVTVRLKVEGVPGLPASYWIRTAGVRGPVHEDPDAGTLTFRLRQVRPDQKAGVTVDAAGYLPASGTFEPPGPLDFDLRKGGVILFRPRPPKDGRVEPMLQRYDEERKTWTMSFAGNPGYTGGRSPTTSAEGQRMEPLARGRYRVLDRSTGVVSEEVEVVPGAPPVVVTLDLSAAGSVRGRVEVPAGEDLKRARIVVKGLLADPFAGPSGDGMGRALGKDGAFEVRVPGDRPVTITAWHPLLSPDPSAGSMTAQEPRDGVVLALVRGRIASLRLDPAPAVGARPGPGNAAIRLLLFRGQVGGEVVFEARPDPEEGGLLRFGGAPAGTYTLWADVPGFAPATLEAVVPESGDVDLGTLRLAVGTTLRVKVLVKEGQSAPRYGLTAMRKGEPIYQRSTYSRGEADIVLPGLGAGTFEIWASPQTGNGPPGLHETVEVDGLHDVERTIDLR